MRLVCEEFFDFLVFFEEVVNNVKFLNFLFFGVYSENIGERCESDFESSNVVCRNIFFYEFVEGFV